MRSCAGFFYFKGAYMRILLGNWHLEKAQNAAEDDKTTPIRMIANRLKLDKENQQILPQAFNKATVDKFIKYGIIDWHHGSVMGRTPEQRAQAILGKPYDFQWEDSLPVVYGRLTKAHPIVRNAILPHLEAGQNVFGASIGGSVRKARNVLDPITKQQRSQIMEIEWEHIALAASPYVISAGSEVSLVKADGMDEPVMHFSDIAAFETDYSLCFSDVTVRKALEMGAGTDIAQLVGADALRVQSRQVPDSYAGYSYNDLVQRVIEGLQNETVGGSVEGVIIFLKGLGLNDDDARAFVKRFDATVRAALI